MLASILILIGVVWLVASVTLVMVNSTAQTSYMTVPFFILQLLLSVAMIGIGAYLVMISMWKVSASVERRGALITQANEFDLLKDLRGLREQMPTVPTNLVSPTRGTVLGYRLPASRRRLFDYSTTKMTKDARNSPNYETQFNRMHHTHPGTCKSTANRHNRSTNQADLRGDGNLSDRFHACQFHDRIRLAANTGSRPERDRHW